MATKVEACFLTWFYNEIRPLLPAPEDDTYASLAKGFGIMTGLSLPTFLTLSAKFEGFIKVPEEWKFEEMPSNTNTNTEIIFFRWFFLYAPERCYGDAEEIRYQLVQRFWEEFRVYPETDSLTSCEGLADLMYLNQELTANKASVLEYLRYFYRAAEDGMGPASIDIYDDIKDRYETKVGAKAPSIPSPTDKETDELKYLMYFYKAAEDVFRRSGGDVEDEIVLSFEKYHKKRAPSFCRDRITYGDIQNY